MSTLILAQFFLTFWSILQFHLNSLNLEYLFFLQRLSQKLAHATSVFYLHEQTKENIQNNVPKNQADAATVQTKKGEC